MHKTNSIDYLVVIAGEMWMVMEEGEVLLRQGDCIVSAAPTTLGSIAAISPACCRDPDPRGAGAMTARMAQTGVVETLG